MDDGCGIHPEDLPLVFASHATSKLTSADDLLRVGTFGFRGEALAAIGGVAQVLLQSRMPELPCGAEISCQGGRLSQVRPWNGAAGTRIEVRHLFYQAPVRRKFLRAPATEMGHVSESFTRLALSRTELHLTLHHNDKLLHEVPASAGLLDRIGIFFGHGLREGLYKIWAEEAGITLGGFIADPALTRGNGQTQYFFVNGRWVRDRTLSHALQEAYRGLLMTGRYAVAFLAVNLPPDQVDVNIHPSKAEVRFRDPEAIHQLVLNTIRARLQAEKLTPKYQMPEPPVRPPQPVATTPTLFEPEPELSALPAPVEAMDDLRQAVSALAPTEAVAAASSRSEASWPGGCKALQLHDCYLVVEVPEGMLVIDQHALHERILFEQLKQRMAVGALDSQRLLVAEPVRFSLAQAALTLERRADLAALGLGVEDAGNGTLLVTAYPAIFRRRRPAEMLRAVVDHLTAQDRVPSREQLLHDLLSLMACHAAVRAGEKLLPEEIAALVARRELATDTHHCPHGRPTGLLFTRKDLDRQFGRV